MSTTRPRRGAHPGRRPRLLVLTTHGMTLRLLARGQLRHLAEERGWDVSAACAPGADLEGAARQEEVEVTPIPALRREISPAADLAALWQLHRLIRRLRPDLVVAGTPKAGFLGVLAARLARVPRVVYVLRGLRLETATGWRRRVLAATEAATARLAHRVLAVSPSLARRHAELGLAPAVGATGSSVTGSGITGSGITVPGAGSSNGVDVERFHPPGAQPGDEVAALLPPGGPVIGFVGRFTRDKGLAELAEAWFGGQPDDSSGDRCGNSPGEPAEALRDRFPEARLLLLGDWEEGDPVAADTRRRLEADPRVVLPGFVADTAPWYRAMAVLAFPSHREGFPNAPLEAAASGVPVAGFAATGTIDAVEDGVTGTLVPTGDAAALATTLERYLDDPDLARRHGEAGRRRAVERYANQRVWQAWADLYAEELAAAGIPNPGAGGAAPGAGAPAHPRRRHRLYRAFGKRLVDLALTLPALVLLSPLVWTLALLVRLFLGSPVLFRQTRPGRDGAPFTLLKFRTMTDETDEAGNLLPDAQRLTRFGRFLRRTSLDELPELVNVLRGDMSLVGPRPLLMHYLERYTPRQALRHEVRPGITGWAVVHGRNALSWEEKFALDVDYVERLSPALDAKILAATARMVVTGTGVSAAGHSTMPEYTGPPGDDEDAG